MSCNHWKLQRTLLAAITLALLFCGWQTAMAQSSQLPQSSAGAGSGPGNANQPRVEVTESVFNYGEVEEGERQKVDVRITIDTFGVSFKGKRITSHPRSYHKGKFTTITEHMPKSHQGYKEWTPSRLISWAEKTGPSTATLIETIMTTRPHPQQGFRSCLGIMSLGKKYTKERLEAAAHRALVIRSYSYRSIRAILESGFDKVATQAKEVIPAIEHDTGAGTTISEEIA